MAANDLELTGHRPPSVAGSRPSSSASRSRLGYHCLQKDAAIDETLFGSNHPRMTEEVDFNPPWSTTPRDKLRSKKPKGHSLLWAPEQRETVSSESSRQNVLRNSNKQRQVEHGYRPVKYTASYCDETLFGPRLEEPSFRAPWAEKTRKPKPFMFSPIDYTKLVRESTTNSDNRYSSAGTLDGRPPSRMGRRPVSASGRPVTVESSMGLERPVWKP